MTAKPTCPTCRGASIGTNDPEVYNACPDPSHATHAPERAHSCGNPNDACDISCMLGAPEPTLKCGHHKANWIFEDEESGHGFCGTCRPERLKPPAPEPTQYAPCPDCGLDLNHQDHLAHCPESALEPERTGETVESHGYITTSQLEAGVCLRCGAVVDGAFMDRHDEWHRSSNNVR